MNFIASYGNSDSEDDADPRSASGVSIKRPLDNQSDRPLKRPINSAGTRLPVPLHFLQSSNTHVDEPTFHDNRIRSFPHERGNWATLVHLSWITTPELVHHINSILLNCKKNNVDLTICDDFHVSLTRTVVLRHHWIEGFNSSIRKQIEDFTSFYLCLQGLAVFVNEERTRTFLAFHIHDTSNTLNLLVQRLNSILEEYQLETFYEEPSHHVSFAWCIGDRGQELEHIISNYNGTCSIVTDRDCCQITEVVCKIGNMKFAYPLKSLQF